MSLLGGTRRCQRHCLKARTAGGMREKSTESQRDIAENGADSLKAKRKTVTHPAEGQKAAEEMQKQERRPASPARTDPAQIHHAPRPFTHRSAASKRFPVGRQWGFSAGCVESEASRSSRCTIPPPGSAPFISYSSPSASLMRQGASRHSNPVPPCRTLIILILHFDNPVNTKQVSLSLPLPSGAHCSLPLSLSLHPVTPADHFDSQ